MKFEYEGQTIEFVIEYRKRKTMQIQIELNGSVKVKAPKGMKDENVLKSVKTKGKWIVQKLAEISKNDYRREEKEFVSGELFMYLGREYPLEIIIDDSTKKPEIKIVNDELYITNKSKDIDALKIATEQWYRSKTSEIILERVEYYQKYFNVKPNNIKVKEQKKRWASCSSKRNLNFNWRCSMAPEWVIDYVVVHEMCHLIHMNHSSDFWQLVENIIPDYKRGREWLRSNGKRMVL